MAGLLSGGMAAVTIFAVVMARGVGGFRIEAVDECGRLRLEHGLRVGLYGVEILDCEAANAYLAESWVGSNVDLFSRGCRVQYSDDHYVLAHCVHADGMYSMAGTLGEEGAAVGTDEVLVGIPLSTAHNGAVIPESLVWEGLASPSAACIESPEAGYCRRVVDAETRRTARDAATDASN